MKNATVPSNPETFKLYNGKLYLFFNDYYEGTAFNTIMPWNSDEEKLKKASLNNVAYAFNQIHTARRLEQGLSTGNVAISIESVYQDAEKAAKDLRKDHGKVAVSLKDDSQD